MDSPINWSDSFSHVACCVDLYIYGTETQKSRRKHGIEKRAENDIKLWNSCRKESCCCIAKFFPWKKLRQEIYSLGKEKQNVPQHTQVQSNGKALNILCYMQNLSVDLAMTVNIAAGFALSSPLVGQESETQCSCI